MVIVYDGKEDKNEDLTSKLFEAHNRLLAKAIERTMRQKYFEDMKRDVKNDIMNDIDIEIDNKAQETIRELEKELNRLFRP